MAHTYLIVLTTLPSAVTARKMARQLVEARLAACVQSLPIRSTYRWKGKIEQSTETLLLAKTRRSLERQVVAFIREHHPYELPEVVCLPITGGLTDYLQWIASETLLPPPKRPGGRH